jgi:hypothetical protein
MTTKMSPDRCLTDRARESISRGESMSRKKTRGIFDTGLLRKLDLRRFGVDNAHAVDAVNAVHIDNAQALCVACPFSLACLATGLCDPQVTLKRCTWRTRGRRCSSWLCICVNNGYARHLCTWSSMRRTARWLRKQGVTSGWGSSSRSGVWLCQQHALQHLRGSFRQVAIIGEGGAGDATASG